MMLGRAFRICSLIGTVIIASPKISSADVHRCLHKDGSVEYTDQICAGAEIVQAPAPSTSSTGPATQVPQLPTTSKADDAATPCAVKEYIAWATSLTSPPEPKLKDRKLRQIDAKCGSSLHTAQVLSTAEEKLAAAQSPQTPPASPRAVQAFPVAPSQVSEKRSSNGEFPAEPDNDRPLIKELPKKSEIVIEVGASIGHPTDHGLDYEAAINIFDLSHLKEYRWDLPKEVLKGLPPQGAQRAAWSAQKSSLLFAKLDNAFMIYADGKAKPLTVLMPGHLKPFDGMEYFAMSRDGSYLASYLYTRDVGERQPDGFGKLYRDLLVERLDGTPPVSILQGMNPPSALAWSPDGQRLAYGKFDGTVVVLDRSGRKLLSVQVGLGTGGTRAAGEMVSRLQWKPNGEHLGILVNATGRLFTLDNSGKIAEIAVTDGEKSDSKIRLQSFDWSPDGGRIVFRSGFETAKNCNHLALGYKFETGSFPCLNGAHLYVANSDGTHLRKITSKPDYSSGALGELLWIR